MTQVEILRNLVKACENLEKINTGLKENDIIVNPPAELRKYWEAFDIAKEYIRNYDKVNDDMG